jgi:phosphohistidine phosphatase SixA
MKFFPCLAAVIALIPMAGSARVLADSQSPSPLANEVVLIIRHAEKQPDGPGLTDQGNQRAEQYVNYFKNFKVDGESRVPDSLFASADSKKTDRCRLTITPLSKALNLPINATIKNKNVADLAKAIEQNPGGKTLLIAWHHEQIGNFLLALGANPLDLIPSNTWPENRYNWLIELRYDGKGHLEPAQDKLIVEHILPSDSAATPSPK